MNARKKILIVIAGAAAALAAASLGVAAIPDGDGVISGCFNKTSGALRVTDTATQKPGGCTAKESALTWAQQGPPGEPGAKGDPGVAEGWAKNTNTGLIPLGGAYQALPGGVQALPPGSYMFTGVANWDALANGWASLRCGIAATGVSGESISGFGYASTSAGGSATFAGFFRVTAGYTGTATVQCRVLNGTSPVSVTGALQITRVSTAHFG